MYDNVQCDSVYVFFLLFISLPFVTFYTCVSSRVIWFSTLLIFSFIHAAVSGVPSIQQLLSIPQTSKVHIS